MKAIDFLVDGARVRVLCAIRRAVLRDYSEGCSLGPFHMHSVRDVCSRALPIQSIACHCWGTPCTVASYLEHALPRPLLDLDDHLVHLEVRQKGRSICSVAREAREVFRSGVTEHTAWSCAFGGCVAPDGIIFENIRARVDCSDDDMFPRFRRRRRRSQPNTL